MVDWDPLTKIKNFPNLMIFDQKTMKMTKNYDFWKNFFLEKFENWMAFDQNSLTITHETAKHDEKIEIFYRKPYDVAEL